MGTGGRGAGRGPGLGPGPGLGTVGAAAAPFPAWLSTGRGAGLCGALPDDLSPPLPSDDLLEPPENASVSLRTTGASIVEDADRTNSPISWSLAMTTLLSTPNSLASS
jgi:hypothetical protein